ncbi:MAG: DNA primase [Xanthomonadales bacterium]|nr:DNA primase [Xanthomonadales bacterium]NIN60168.1 DNA primase [Xanthomonadales bacterium]NIN74315.1 DNA primase [Xanthomonadales bacterium]NIO12824.1 DNA primase [Xanthomonadales bacterium]NIP12561.1 DNA primase [Xanthomonadales bacterium]
MSGRIPESFVEELLARTDIVEVIERRVELKRAGAEFKACCPFHEEKTPSFTVSPRKQFYHCFGCGAHGSAIGFLMQFEGLEFPDAVEELARNAGLEVPRSKSRSQPRAQAGLYEVLERAAEFFSAQLPTHAGAVEYLKSRGLSGEICRDFRIGYAPDSWHALQEHLGREAGMPTLMQRAGLLSEGKGKSYDKFRNRIMFPIQDRRGRVIAFGGRALQDDGPKYLNSPETEIFHKGRELYGLYLARQRAGRLASIIVVEGYTDVVALAQFGLRHVVATLGTATTLQQAELLFRAADTVVYCFDGDEAGRKAAWRALEATLPQLREGRQARFLFLPEGEDPDSLIRRQGREAFEELLEDAQPLSEFLFEHFTEQLDMQSIDGRARLVELAMPLLDALPAGVFRNMMLERLESLAQHRLPSQRRPPAPAGGRAPAERSGSARTPMRLAMAHLVQNPGLVEYAGTLDEFAGCDLPGVDLFLELVEFCGQRPNITTAQLLELWRDHPGQKHLRKLAMWQLPGAPEQQALEFRDAVTGVRLQWVAQQLASLPRIVEQSNEERDRFRDLQQRQQDLKKDLRGALD